MRVSSMEDSDPIHHAKEEQCRSHETEGILRARRG